MGVVAILEKALRTRVRLLNLRLVSFETKLRTPRAEVRP